MSLKVGHCEYLRVLLGSPHLQKQYLSKCLQTVGMAMGWAFLGSVVQSQTQINTISALDHPGFGQTSYRSLQSCSDCLSGNFKCCTTFLAKKVANVNLSGRNFQIFLSYFIWHHQAEVFFPVL